MPAHFSAPMSLLRWILPEIIHLAARPTLFEAESKRLPRPLSPLPVSKWSTMRSPLGWTQAHICRQIVQTAGHRVFACTRNQCKTSPKSILAALLTNRIERHRSIHRFQSILIPRKKNSLIFREFVPFQNQASHCQEHYRLLVLGRSAYRLFHLQCQRLVWPFLSAPNE